MAKDEDDSPKKSKKSNGKSKKGTLFYNILYSIFLTPIEVDDTLSSQSSSSPSSQSQDASSSSSSSTTVDGDVIVTQFKDNPKLRKEFQRKLNKILDAKENMNNVDPNVLAASEKKGKKSNLTPLEQQYVAIKKEYHIRF